MAKQYNIENKLSNVIKEIVKNETTLGLQVHRMDNDRLSSKYVFDSDKIWWIKVQAVEIMAL